MAVRNAHHPPPTYVPARSGVLDAAKELEKLSKREGEAVGKVRSRCLVAPARARRRLVPRAELRAGLLLCSFTAQPSLVTPRLPLYSMLFTATAVPLSRPAAGPVAAQDGAAWLPGQDP